MKVTNLIHLKKSRIHIIKLIALFSIILVLFTLISSSVAASGSLPQAEATATLPPSTPVDFGEGTTISGNFYTALLNVVGFTCISILLLVAVLWFLNNRRRPK